MNEKYSSPPDIYNQSNEADREVADFCDTCARELSQIQGDIIHDLEHKQIQLSAAPDTADIIKTQEFLSTGGELTWKNPLVAYIVPDSIYTSPEIEEKTKQTRLDTVKLLCYISGMYLPQWVQGLHYYTHTHKIDEQKQDLVFDQWFASRVFQLHKSCGNPKIKLSTGFKSRYKPIKNRINLNTCEYNFGYQRRSVTNLRVSELSHAVQEHNHGGNLPRRYIRESIQRLFGIKRSYDSTYNKEGYTEYEAHSEIEPALAYRLYFSDPNNISTYIHTNLKNHPPHRQLFEARNFLVLIYIAEHQSTDTWCIQAPAIDQELKYKLEKYVWQAYVSSIYTIETAWDQTTTSVSQIDKTKEQLRESYNTLYTRGNIKQLLNPYHDWSIHSNDIPNELEEGLVKYLEGLVQ